MGTIERIYSGPDRAFSSKSRKIVYGLPISVFLKGREATRTVSEGGTVCIVEVVGVILSAGE